MDWMAFTGTVLAVVMAASAIVGTLAHSSTLLVLHRLRQQIKSSLDATSLHLMISLAICDLLYSGAALPLIAWNMFVGDSWPFNSTSFPVCYYQHLWLANLAHVSLFHATTLAAFRFLAVFKPHTYTHISKSRSMNVCVVAAPWFLGSVLSLIGLASHLYQCAFVPRFGLCLDLPYDLDSKYSQKLYSIYNTVNNGFNTIAPIIIGCILYSYALLKLSKRLKLRRSRKVGPIPLATGAAKSGLVAMKVSTLAGSTALQSIGKKELAARNYRSVRIIAFASFANLLFFCPGHIIATVSIWFPDALNWSYVTLVSFMVFYIGSCVTPFVYFASSTDMRAEYAKLIKGLLHV